MRLQRVAKPFEYTDYIFELKHDGSRAIAYIEVGESGLVSRNLKQFSFVPLSNSLARLPVKNAILDGEVVCLDGKGISQFNQLLISPVATNFLRVRFTRLGRVTSRVLTESGVGVL